MPNAIDQRLASLLHQRRIRALTRIDRLTRAVGRIYERMGRELLRLAVVPEADVAAQIDDTTASYFAQAHTMIRRGFESEARTSHQATSDAMLRAVPWRWFRKINPMVMEAEEPVFDWGDLSKDEKRAAIEELLFPPPDAQAVEEMLDYSGPGGMAWDERLEYWEAGSREKIRTSLIGAISDPEGVGVPAIRKILEPLVGGIRYKAQRIARTEGRRVAELAQDHAWSQVSELIDAFQVMATFSHTRPEHAARHGKKYTQQSDGSYIADDGEPLPVLPDAPNCLCFKTPILAVPAEIENDPIVRAQFENADRDVIPDPGSYNQWWAGASEAEKRRSVGGRRYSIVAKRLASQGRAPEWEDFLDPTGKLMPVDKLKRQTWKAWETRRGKVAEMVAERERVMRQVAATGFDWPKHTRQPPATSPRRIAQLCGLVEAQSEVCRRSKAEIAKANAKRVGKHVQRYSEERNEAEFARQIGGRSMDDNEPTDVEWQDGKKTHGIELKTLVDNKHNKLTMKRSAMERKAQWERKRRHVFHTVVFDDESVIPGSTIGEKSAALEKLLTSGQAEGFKPGARRIFYRRGYGSFRVNGMHEITGGIDELKELMRTPRSKLPQGAI